MRHQRHARRVARLSFLLAIGLMLGALGGWQIGVMIQRAGFGTPLAAPAEARAEKPTEEDRLIGAALAAHTGVDEPADCRALAPRLRAGCRDYVEQRRQEEGIFGPLPSVQSVNHGEAAGATRADASDWPARPD